MNPHAVDWREALNDPLWDEMELRNLMRICEEKIMQLRGPRRGR
jgi:hypothetical protein